jgi:hypothetical protein
MNFSRGAGEVAARGCGLTRERYQSGRVRSTQPPPLGTDTTRHTTHHRFVWGVAWLQNLHVLSALLIK